MRRTLYIGLLTLTAVALLAFAACSSESYPGLTYEDGVEAENHETLSNDDASGTPIQVFVNEQTFLSLNGGASSRQQDMTRGIGTFQTPRDEDIANQLSTMSDEEKQFINQKYERTNFYIYAFRAKEQTQPVVDKPDFRRYNLVDEDSPLAHAPGASFADTKDRWHCLVDGQDYYKGLLARLEMHIKDDESDNATANDLLWSYNGLAYSEKFNLKTPIDEKTGERKILYYPDRGDVGYNFFAYSIGDISTDDFSTEDQSVNWGTPERLEDQVVYRNFTIDGAQDIMAGYAPPIEHAANSAPDLTQEERELVKVFGYSTFAAHRGIDPMINLRHQMTRIRFRGVAGAPSANHTSIHSIHVKCYNKGDFIVAHRDTNQVGFHPYTQSTDMLGDVYVHDASTVTKDEDGNVVLVKSKIHDTEGLDKNGDPIHDRQECWHVDWHDWDWKDPERPGGYNKYEDEEKPEKLTGVVDLDTRLKDAVTWGDDLLIPSCDSIVIYTRAYFHANLNYNNTSGGAPVYNSRPFTSKYTVKAADRVKLYPHLEDKYLDDKHFAETGEKHYIFKPGYLYTINLAVYGTEVIDADANVDPWKIADDITVGEDDPDMTYD